MTLSVDTLDVAFWFRRVHSPEVSLDVPRTCSSVMNTEGHDLTEFVAGYHTLAAIHRGERGEGGFTPVTVEFGPHVPRDNQSR